MQYVRLFADSDGNSHMEDVSVPMEMADFAPPAPPLQVSSFNPASQYGFLIGPPDWYGDWHPVPHRQLMYVLAGEGEVETSDGEVRRLGLGGGGLFEDTTGKGHRTRNVGEGEFVVFVVQIPG